MFGACMGVAHATGWLGTRDCVVISIGLGGIVDTASPHWWRQLGGRRLSVVLGERMLTTLRLARFAGWAAGPLGFFVITA